MSVTPPVLVIHGIWNLRKGSAAEAAAELAASWQPRLADGYRDAGLSHVVPPPISVAYYADLLNPAVQGAGERLDTLTIAERELLWGWLVELGVPAGPGQGAPTVPIRQGLDWLARRTGRSADVLARIMTAVLTEVYIYLTRPAVRSRVRAAVAAAIDKYRPRIVIAHSLGSVVGYETLHATGAEVDLLLTLGSPLGLPGAVFEALDPEPVNGRGARPAGVNRWVNIADPGDIVSVPTRLGDRFPVDLHDEVDVGFVDFHTLGGYLATGLVAAAIMPYVS